MSFHARDVDAGIAEAAEIENLGFDLGATREGAEMLWSRKTIVEQLARTLDGGALQPVLLGEPGVGKSSIVATLARVVRGDVARVAPSANSPAGSAPAEDHLVTVPDMLSGALYVNHLDKLKLIVADCQSPAPSSSSTTWRRSPARAPRRPIPIATWRTCWCLSSREAHCGSSRRRRPRTGWSSGASVLRSLGCSRRSGSRRPPRRRPRPCSRRGPTTGPNGTGCASARALCPRRSILPTASTPGSACRGRRATSSSARWP